MLVEGAAVNGGRRQPVPVGGAPARSRLATTDAIDPAGAKAGARGRPRAIARRALLATLLLAGLLVLAGPASAGIWWTWGYNHINSTNPSAGETGHCPSSRSGIACSGFNYSDQNDVAHQYSGGWIIQGFQNCIGCTIWGVERYIPSGSGSNPYSLAWNDYRLNGAVNHYNRVACSYRFGIPGNPGSYIQCRALIWP